MSATPAQEPPSPTTTAELLERVRDRHPELFVAPPVEAWPQGLPLPLKTPREARCFDAGGNELGAGAWIPKARADVIAARLRRLEVYPGQSQQRIDELAGAIGDENICTAAGEGATDAAVTAADVRCVETAAAPGEGYSLSTLLAWIGGTAVVTAVATMFALAMK